MNYSRKIVAALFTTIHLTLAAWSAEPSLNDFLLSNAWISPATADQGQYLLPFSFELDGKASEQFLSQWRRTTTTERLDSNRLRRVTVYTQPDSNLTVKCVAVEYNDFPALEWTLYFSNSGQSDTPIIENVQALDALFAASPVEDAVLHYSLGSHDRADDFTPKEQALNQSIHLAPIGGRSSDGILPFFNLTNLKDGGIMLGVGWTGQWAANFEKTEQNQIHVLAGMERTHLRLHPGEEIRTPAILALFYSGKDSLRGQNQLRRLLLKHYTPMDKGKPVKYPIAASPHAAIGFTDTTEANMIEGIENIAAHQFPVDTWWIDAGWHGKTNNWALNVGSWEPNSERFPHGLKPVADAAHSHGLRFLLWCEPERVMPDTWLFDNHPEWLLTPADLPKEFLYHEKDRFRLLNLGNPEALAWAKSTFSQLIGDLNLEIYRQDFNMAPLYYWRNNEPEDRQGMNEIRYIMGLYDYYDTLAREHPGLIIDTCASGGRRIDFEMLRRSLILFRSDHVWEPVGLHSMAYGVSFWLPITGVGAVSVDPYDFRSGWGSHLTLALDYYKSADIWARAKAQMDIYQKIRHLFPADYYPLTPYSLDKDKWISWQFNDPDAKEGMIQAFRRDQCESDTLQVKPSALDPAATYTIANLDTNESITKTGAELMNEGLLMRAATKPAALVYHYKAQ